MWHIFYTNNCSASDITIQTEDMGTCRWPMQLVVISLGLCVREIDGTENDKAALFHNELPVVTLPVRTCVVYNTRVLIKQLFLLLIRQKEEWRDLILYVYRCIAVLYTRWLLWHAVLYIVGIQVIEIRVQNAFVFFVICILIHFQKFFLYFVIVYYLIYYLSVIMY